MTSPGEAVDRISTKPVSYPLCTMFAFATALITLPESQVFLSHSRTDIRLSEHLMDLCFSWPGNLCGCSMANPADAEASIILGRASGCHTRTAWLLYWNTLVVSSLARCFFSGKPGRVLEFLAKEMGESFGKPFLPPPNIGFCHLLL